MVLSGCSELFFVMKSLSTVKRNKNNSEIGGSKLGLGLGLRSCCCLGSQMLWVEAFCLGWSNEVSKYFRGGYELTRLKSNQVLIIKE